MLFFVTHANIITFVFSNKVYTLSLMKYKTLYYLLLKLRSLNLMPLHCQACYDLNRSQYLIVSDELLRFL